MTLKPHFIPKLLEDEGCPLCFPHSQSSSLRKGQLFNIAQQAEHAMAPAGCRPPASSCSSLHTWPSSHLAMLWVPSTHGICSLSLECFLFSPVLLPTPHPHSGLPVPLLFQISPETSLQGACPDCTPHSSALNYSACIFRAFRPLSDISSIKAGIKSVWLKV